MHENGKQEVLQNSDHWMYSLSCHDTSRLYSSAKGADLEEKWLSPVGDITSANDATIDGPDT